MIGLIALLVGSKVLVPMLLSSNSQHAWQVSFVYLHTYALLFWFLVPMLLSSNSQRA